MPSACLLKGHFSYRERGGQFKQIAESYYGLVIENFECEQSIYTAVEVGIFYILNSVSVQIRELVKQSNFKIVFRTK